MSTKVNEVKQIAAQLLAGMLANPHIYASISDEMSKGRQEQELMEMAIQMAKILIAKVEQRTD
ncbi:MAG: hypothetical protein AB4038_21245 [Prochloraceae cyanobacterium]